MWKTLFNTPLAAIGTSLVVFFLFLAVFGRFLAPYGLNEQVGSAALQPPSAEHWFGTDQLGRDIFSRVLHGSADVIGLAGSGTALAVLFGTLLGLLTGYWGGWFDDLLMRFFDTLLAIPALLLALLMLGTLGANVYSILIVLAVVYTPIVARVVRSVTLGLKQTAYVEAARALGAGQARILLISVLPNCMAPIIVQTTLSLGTAILDAAGLSFLGLGAQPPTPEWGAMLAGGRELLLEAPWVMTFPGLAIFAVVLALNLFGDGLRDALDPKTIRDG